MNTCVLQKLFDELKLNNIYINFDDDFIFTSNKKVKYKKNDYIGCIESETIINDFETIMESLYEEGSAKLYYKFVSSSKTNYKNTIPLLLQAIFNKFNYEPFITIDNKNIKIEFIIALEETTGNFKLKYLEYKNKREHEEENEEEN